MKALWAMPVALLLGGCQLFPTASCDFRPVEPRCQEKQDTPAAEVFKGTCAGAMFHAADGHCPKEGQVGGCNLGAQGDGSTVIDWYYAPETASGIEVKCGNASHLFVGP
jgi:hypothetical protein